MDKALVFIVSGYFFYIVALGVFIFLTRKKALENKEVKMSYFKSYSSEATEELTVVQNHFNNQFQMPVVFMMVSLLSLQQETVNIVTVILAALFFVSRLAHSYIHLGNNNVLNRAKAYFFGVFIVGLMFVQLIVAIV